ncbi:glycosyltransferase family 4 protein [Flavobacterium ammonificans]|uniref:glycosyltransferase family 4 protein n=1 Tax=Flavobacterium ammonificans TaxID=1751056 RepID=UPI001E2F7046|nr:glycosyltransferase family 4 protein [Flavobacterium ammonificans]BDB56770.1 group 1 glycosyl transferase [Flavobacterium ammonificans]
MKPKLFRVTTVSESLKILLKGQHKFMSENGFEVIGVASNSKALDETSQDENIRVIGLNMTRKITLFKDILSVYYFFKILKKEKPIIVHSHTPKAGIVSMLASKLANVPIRLHTVAGLPLMEAKGNKRKLLNFVEKVTYVCATNVYPNSKGLYQFIVNEELVSSKKLKVIANGSSNGIDTSYFDSESILEVQKEDLRTKLNIHNTDFVFIFVGRLVGDKGINELIEAFSRINDYNVKLVLVGGAESDLDPLFEETINKIEKNPNIISVGFQSDVRPYFAISNCLVFPSYREGFPNVVMQAGAMGLPSIVSDINGCNEIIEEGINGTIIPVKDPKSLFESMLKMVNNEHWRCQLAGNARDKIVSRFEQQVVWDAILNEYKSLLIEKGLQNV